MKKLSLVLPLLAASLLASCSTWDIEEGSISSINTKDSTIKLWIDHEEYSFLGNESGEPFGSFQVGDVVTYRCEFENHRHHPYITKHYSMPFTAAVSGFDTVNGSVVPLCRQQDGDLPLEYNYSGIAFSSLHSGDSVEIACRHNNVRHEHHLILLSKKT